MFTPCRDCNKRQVGCHSSCEEYKRFVEEHEKLKRHAKEHEPPILTKWSWLSGVGMDILILLGKDVDMMENFLELFSLSLLTSVRIYDIMITRW